MWARGAANASPARDRCLHGGSVPAMITGTAVDGSSGPRPNHRSTRDIPEATRARRQLQLRADRLPLLYAGWTERYQGAAPRVGLPFLRFAITAELPVCMALVDAVTGACQKTAFTSSGRSQRLFTTDRRPLRALVEAWCDWRPAGPTLPETRRFAGADRQRWSAAAPTPPRPQPRRARPARPAYSTLAAATSRRRP